MFIQGKQNKNQEEFDDQHLKEMIKKLRQDLCQKEIENASLRADQIRSQGQNDEAVRKLVQDADFEKTQVSL